MCLLVIMCALALIWDATGAAVTADNRTPVIRGDCLHECVPRCKQLTIMKDITCCDCITMCETACGSSKIDSNLLEDRITHPQTPLCSCDPADVVGRRPSVPRRTRRRPSRSPMLKEAAIIARSVGLELAPRDIGSDSSDVTTSNEKVVLRLVSLVPEEDSLTAVVSWDSSSPSLSPGTPWYLVTWEPQGGGVRGNLLTNSTSTSLTLWPDNVYQVHVSSASSRTASSCLEVDTHYVATLAQDVTPRVVPWRVEVLGVTAAVVLFLVVLVSVTRCRSSSKHCDQSHQDCDRYKLYPPPVTLHHANVTLSTEHLA
ncbi:uncharacterized protein LOC128987336 [Macrosteles quadrilineatus]|uniref:uncharacterized protein LOC128987336 n=1 Tax=Macrosteles quadrilineatus TaxID=74068 RepID=UPI0023E18945|nr:uncharacterized protein LOC128987336 [Macrosteles quadrilineatus]